MAILFLYFLSILSLSFDKKKILEKKGADLLYRENRVLIVRLDDCANNQLQGV